MENKLLEFLLNNDAVSAWLYGIKSEFKTTHNQRDGTFIPLYDNQWLKEAMPQELFIVNVDKKFIIVKDQNPQELFEIVMLIAKQNALTFFPRMAGKLEQIAENFEHLSVQNDGKVCSLMYYETVIEQINNAPEKALNINTAYLQRRLDTMTSTYQQVLDLKKQNPLFFTDIYFEKYEPLSLRAPNYQNGTLKIVTMYGDEVQFSPLDKQENKQLLEQALSKLNKNSRQLQELMAFAKEFDLSIWNLVDTSKEFSFGVMSNQNENFDEDFYGPAHQYKTTINNAIQWAKKHELNMCLA